MEGRSVDKRIVVFLHTCTLSKCPLLIPISNVAFRGAAEHTKSRRSGHDFCARVGPGSRCFCGRPFEDHQWGKRGEPTCTATKCTRFQFVPYPLKAVVVLSIFVPAFRGSPNSYDAGTQEVHLHKKGQRSANLPNT